MLEIYAPFILNSGITQETEVPSVEIFNKELFQTGKKDHGSFVKSITRSRYAYAGKTS
jgi:hypothetical protein